MGRKPECKLAGLRTEIAYKAGAARQVGHASRSRFRPVAKAGTHRRWVGGARARKVHVLIRGDLSDVPGSRACPKARAVHAKVTRCWTEVSRRHSTRLHTPLQQGRPKRDAQVRAWLTSLRQAGSAELEPQGGQSSAAANRKAGLDE